MDIATRPLTDASGSACAVGSFALLIKDYWRRSRPTMYADLQEQGLLDERVSAADRLTVATLAQLIEHGLSWARAWELVRCEWTIFPVENQPTG